MSEVEKGQRGEGAEGQRGLGAHVRVVREGHGANCSSIGSVIDTLFATAAVGGALLAAVAAAVRDERAHANADAHANAHAHADADADADPGAS